uniref:Claudin n=1 Tax=Cyclopterus lumpus TaxID=8103 RepID=A0A8C2ZPE7_CYCLU
MVATICQVMGFLLSLLGVAGVIAATGMDQWATEDLFDNPVTAVFSYSGLWNSCVRQSSGFTECRPYFTILGLPGTSLFCQKILEGTEKIHLKIYKMSIFLVVDSRKSTRFTL